MRNCQNCGKPLENDADFCPDCGSAVSAGKERASGSSRKYKIIGVSAVVAATVVLVVLAVTVLPGLLRSDAENFVYYQQRFLVESLLNAVTSGANGALSAPNTDLTVTARVDEPILGALVNGSSLILKLKAEKGRFIANAAANFMGGRLLAGALSFEDGVLDFYLPQVENVIYSVDIPELLGVSDLYDDFLKDLDVKGLVRCVQKYLEIFFSVVNDENLTVEKNKNIPYAALEGDFKGSLYVFAPSARDIRDMLEKLADALEGDKFLAGLLYARFASNGGCQREDAEKLLSDAARRLRDSAGETGETLENSGFRWILGVEGKTVRRILITASGSGVGVEIYGAADDRNGESFALFSLGDGGEVQPILSGQYIEEGKKVTGRMELTAAEETFIFSFDCEPGNASPLGWPCGSYELRTEGPDRSSTVSLAVRKADDGSVDHTVTLAGEGISLNINAIWESSAAMPDAPVEDITGYSPAELEEFFSELRYALGQGLGVYMRGLLGGLIDGGSFVFFEGSGGLAQVSAGSCQ